jgi:hypothetical protein
VIGKFNGEKFEKEYAQKQHAFQFTALDKWITSYNPLNQIIQKNREEIIGSEEDNISRVTTLESSDFENVWSFNHPHLSVKKHREKLCQVEKGTFWVF